jgi:hypothetical protein
MAASQEGGAAVTVSLTKVSAGRDVYIKVDTAVQDEQFRRNRRQMLEKVRLTWIKGVLVERFVNSYEVMVVYVGMAF